MKTEELDFRGASHDRGLEVLIALVVVMETTGTTDPVAWLVNYGIAGVVIALLITGQFRTKAEVQRMESQIDHLIAEIASKDKVIEAFQLQLTGHTLPALAQSARVLEAIPSSESALLGQLQRARDETASLAARLEALAKGATPQ